MASTRGVAGRVGRLVWNATERRPTAPVRVVVAVVLFGTVVTALQLGTLFALEPVEALTDEQVLLLAALALQVGLLVAALATAVFVDRRRFADFGLGLDRQWWVDLGFGLALGAALMTGIFLVSSAAGWARVEGTFVTEPGSLFAGFLPNFLFLTAFMLVVGVAEELVVRGWLLTNLAEGLDGTGVVGRRGAIAAAVVGSSVLFGLLHATNPGASTASTAGITLAGVMLAAGYVLTGDLGVPVGLHITWNLFQGGVYGFPISGLDFGVRVIGTVEQGPDLFTGGEFGPEAGLLGVAATVVGTAAIALYARWRTGDLRLDHSIATPSLRWEPEPGETTAAEGQAEA